MLSFINFKCQRGSQVLIDNANLSIFAKQKVGLIGKNGAGKSSLFAILRGELEASQGDVQIPKNLRIAHLEQETPGLEDSALAFVLAGDTVLTSIQTAIIQAELAEDYEKVMALYEKLGDIDGYTAESRAAKILHGLGFADEAFSQAVKTFSGGWRMRLNLARCLMMPSDLMLLDEPTNHLDLETIVWLEKWLNNYSGILVIISHDKDFLDGVVDTILHLENQQLKLYRGNYSAFEDLRAQEIILHQAQYDKQQNKIAHLQSFVDRFRAKASKAKQAQSRMRAMDRMEKLAPLYAQSELQFDFYTPEKTGNPLIHCDKIIVGYDNKPILKNVNVSVTQTARIGLIGKNGAGKSTFINLLTGKLPAMQGQLTKHAAVKVGHFAQHQVDQLQLNESAFEHLQDLDRKISTQEVRNFLGNFAFQGDKVFDPVMKFSGGEKARLALALLVFQKPNLLLLDEPANHLDMSMREALTLALQNYAGALILVSHDRHLLRSTVNELWLVENGNIKEFNGDVQDYVKLSGS
jgi:ATP-binding cassette subfamily F protein 3